MKIELVNDTYKLLDQVNWDSERSGELKEVFRDGKLLIDLTLDEIRKRVNKNNGDHHG